MLSLLMVFSCFWLRALECVLISAWVVCSRTSMEVTCILPIHTATTITVMMDTVMVMTMVVLAATATVPK